MYNAMSTVETMVLSCRIYTISPSIPLWIATSNSCIVWNNKWCKAVTSQVLAVQLIFVIVLFKSLRYKSSLSLLILLMLLLFVGAASTMAFVVPVPTVDDGGNIKSFSLIFYCFLFILHITDTTTYIQNKHKWPKQCPQTHSNVICDEQQLLRVFLYFFCHNLIP